MLTEWEEYVSVDLDHLKELMKVPILVDGSNMFEPTAVRAHGLECYTTVWGGRKCTPDRIRTACGSGGILTLTEAFEKTQREGVLGNRS